MALATAPKRPLPPEYEIKENYPREMTEEEIQQVRDKTITEIRDVILSPDEPQRPRPADWERDDEDDEPFVPGAEAPLPFGERVIIRGGGRPGRDVQAYQSHGAAAHRLCQVHRATEGNRP